MGLGLDEDRTCRGDAKRIPLRPARRPKLLEVWRQPAEAKAIEERGVSILSEGV
jgi:hypothetical protein